MWLKVELCLGQKEAGRKKNDDKRRMRRRQCLMRASYREVINAVSKEIILVKADI